MSSSTWTPRAVASEAVPCRLELWRAVEAQHVVATSALVDSLVEQEVLEAIRERSMPPVPMPATGHDYLLYTPFGIRHRGMAPVFAGTAIRVSGMAQKRYAPAAPNSATGVGAS